MILKYWDEKKPYILNLNKLLFKTQKGICLITEFYLKDIQIEYNHHFSLQKTKSYQTMIKR